MKRVLSLLLALTMLICVLPASVLAEGTSNMIISPFVEDMGENLAAYVKPYYESLDGISRASDTGTTKMCDGDETTYDSPFIDPVHRLYGVKGALTFNFGQIVSVTDVVIKMNNAKLNKIAIEYSQDLDNWTRISTHKYPKNGIRISFPVVKAKGIRIAILSCEYTPQIREIEIYNTSDEPTFTDKSMLLPPTPYGTLTEHAEGPLLMELQEPADAHLAHEDENGDLVYGAYDDLGQTIGEWGRVGYQNGEKPIPFIETAVTVTPNGKDDTKAIQAAVDAVAAMPVQENGFRGAVYLEKGTYYVSNTININVGGIVIRGAGNTGSGEDGTVVVATGRTKYKLFDFVGTGKVGDYQQVGRDYQIQGDFVGTGTRELELDSTEGLEKGDRIIVQRAESLDWLGLIRMDARGGVLSGTGAWKVHNYTFLFERDIVDVKGNTIVLDTPMMKSLERKYGMGRVYKFEAPGRIQNLGIEDLSIDSVYDESVRQAADSTTADAGEYIDENHLETAVRFYWVENAWARNIDVKHTSVWGFLSDDFSRNVTFENCKVTDYISQIAGSRRYSFALDGIYCLVKDCYAKGGRHDFVINRRICAGPNVFVDSLAEDTRARSETHQRYAIGGLWDNIVLRGTKSNGFFAGNRGMNGSGHGWTGDHMIFWNCASTMIMVEQPPGGQNFAVGLSELIKPGEPDTIPMTEVLRVLNQEAGYGGILYYYQGEPFVGDGYFELNDRPAKIRSLYARQHIEAYKDLSYFFRADDSGYIYLNERQDCPNPLFYENGTAMIPMALAKEILNKKTEEELLALAGTSTQKDGVTYLPLQQVFEAAGMNVYYNDDIITVTNYDNYFMTDEEIQSVLHSVSVKF